ncbi:MAG: DNA repair exonuclease [Abditibacteriota bacterium]|nr:DNA repair exonuclease [Abditibacteriota bacterium]
MKILCTADLHLGNFSKKIPEKYNIEDFTAEKAWYDIIDIASQNNYDAILICGDILDEDTSTFTSRQILNNGFEKLKDKNIEVVMIPGNHDKSRLSDLLSNTPYSFVHLIGCGCKWQRFDLNGLSIYGFGLDDDLKTNPFKRKLKNEDNKEIKLKIEDDKYIIMIHGDYNANEKDNKYGPFKDSLNGDVINNSIITLIGHTHKKEEKDKYVSLGSPQAFDFGEKGEHGFWTLELDEKLDKVNFCFESFSKVYYELVDADVSDFSDEHSLSSILNENLECKHSLNLYKVNLIGNLSKEKHDKIREEMEENQSAVNGYVAEDVYVSEFIDNIEGVYNLGEMAKQPNAIGVVAEMILSIDDGTFIEKYGDSFVKYKEQSEEYTEPARNGYYDYLDDEELLKFIRKSLIDILPGESDKNE